MAILRTGSDEPLPHYLRLAILGLLGLALVATLMSLVLGASRWLRMPDGVVHARKAPKPKPVTADDFLEQLNTAVTTAPGAPAAGTAETAAAAAASTDPANRRFAEEVQAMLKCAHDFAARAGRDEAPLDAAAVEDFRSQFEKVAQATPERGEAWAGDVSQFVCSTLEEKDALSAAKAGHLEQPLVATVNYHIARWDEAHRKVHEFDAQEKRRVESETVQEGRRMVEAQAGVSAALQAAGLSFALFLALAACLILAGIDASLRGIRNSLEDLAARDLAGVPLPLVSEEVDAQGAAAESAKGSRDLGEIHLSDPMEVEYQIPEQALGRG